MTTIISILTTYCLEKCVTSYWHYSKVRTDALPDFSTSTCLIKY